MEKRNKIEHKMELGRYTGLTTFHYKQPGYPRFCWSRSAHIYNPTLDKRHDWENRSSESDEFCFASLKEISILLEASGALSVVNTKIVIQQ